MTRALERLLSSFACIGAVVIGMVLGWAIGGVAIALVLR
jgi:hypothetical protein